MDVTEEFFQVIDSLVDHALNTYAARDTTEYGRQAAKVRKAIRTLAMRCNIVLDGAFKGLLEDKYGNDAQIDVPREAQQANE